MIEHLNKVNDIEIIDVHDERFKTYGRIIEGIDVSELCAYMNAHTDIPSSGNRYAASVEEMEAMDACRVIQAVIYGGMPIEIGYCNGVNSTYNGFEYHKGSEINIAVTDFMLVLSHTWKIVNNTIHTEDAEVFYIPAGTVIEMYQTTLHLSPCRVHEEGFKDIVILPRGTNTPLSEEEKKLRDESGDREGELLLQKNKWVLSHPDREPLMKQGAHPGLIGENKELKF